jgi:hypothetical protein
MSVLHVYPIVIISCVALSGVYVKAKTKGVRQYTEYSHLAYPLSAVVESTSTRRVVQLGVRQLLSPQELGHSALVSLGLRQQ